MSPQVAETARAHDSNVLPAPSPTNALAAFRPTAPQAVLQAIPHPVFCKDMEGRYTYVNDAFCLRKRRNADEILGRSDAELFSAARAQEYRLDDLCALMTGKTLERLDHRRSEDGAERRVQVVKVPLYDKFGCLVGVQGMYWDVPSATHTGNGAPAAKNSGGKHQSLSHGVHVTKEFFLALERELRVPLQVIATRAELLAAEPIPPAARMRVRDIAQANRSLRGMLRDTAALAGLEDGADAVDFNLVDLIEMIVAAHAETSTHPRLEFVCDIDPSLPTIVCGYPNHLQFAIDHLLHHVSAQAVCGNVTMTVTIDRVTAEEIDLRFAVRGPVAEADETLSAMSPVDFGASNVDRSTDLARIHLVLANHLFTAINGRVDEKSAAGARAFEVRLSLRPAAHAAPPPSVASARARLLIASDHAETRASLCHQLRALGVPHDSAADGDGALALLHAAFDDHAPYAIAILDLRDVTIDSERLAHTIKANLALAPTKLVQLLPSPLDGRRPPLPSPGFVAQLARPVLRRQLHATLDDLAQPRDLGDDDTSREQVSPLRVLLVDDNEVNRRVGLRQLRALGINADLAINGRDAVHAVESKPYDVILMDCQMPEMDGCEAARAIRSWEATCTGDHHSRLRIIAYTADVTDRCRRECVAAGMDGFVSKPTTIPALKAALEEQIPVAAR